MKGPAARAAGPFCFQSSRGKGSRPETVLHGRLPDQSALAGVLAHLDELGIEIVDVSLVPELPPEQAAGPAGHS